MLGAIVGDIVGSIYEWNRIKTKDFPLFADDCILQMIQLWKWIRYESIPVCMGDGLRVCSKDRDVAIKWLGKCG